MPYVEVQGVKCYYDNNEMFDMEQKANNYRDFRNVPSACTGLSLDADVAKFETYKTDDGRFVLLNKKHAEKKGIKPMREFRRCSRCPGWLTILDNGDPV